jgi:hypothetical protein
MGLLTGEVGGVDCRLSMISGSLCGDVKRSRRCYEQLVQIPHQTHQRAVGRTARVDTVMIGLVKAAEEWNARPCWV